MPLIVMADSKYLVKRGVCTLSVVHIPSFILHPLSMHEGIHYIYKSHAKVENLLVAHGDGSYFKNSMMIL